MKKKTTTNEFEPKNSKWLNMKIMTSGGEINLLVKGLLTLKTRGVKVEITRTQRNLIELNLHTNKPNLYSFMLKLARFSVGKGMMFKAVFKDFEHSLDWCGYYETNMYSTLEGSRLNNRTKIERLLETYF